MRTSDGVGKTDQLRPAAGTMVMTSRVALEEGAGDDLQAEDPFQWFVDLFVAEYASEGSSPNAR